MTRKTSADFEVGQRVKCIDPEQFLSATAKYLANRVGTVSSVTPPARTRDLENYCGHINKVFVLWHKRNGRGKEQQMMMSPGDIQVIEVDS